MLRDNVMIRRLALEKLYRPLGFPTIAFPCEMTSDPIDEAIIAGTCISKYSGIIILNDLKGEVLFPLLLQRLNIFTDPQRPMTTEQGIYPINNPGPDSPVLITSNFSLTYFIVSGEVEASRIPSWLLVLNTDGLSVLTAWAARQVRCRPHRTVREEVRHRRQDQGEKNHHTWSSCHYQRRPRRRTLRVGSGNRSQGRGTHPCIPAPELRFLVFRRPDRRSSGEKVMHPPMIVSCRHGRRHTFRFCPDW